MAEKESAGGQPPAESKTQAAPMKIVVDRGDRQAEREADLEAEVFLGRTKHITSTVMVIAVWAGIALCTWALTGISDGRGMVAYVSAGAFIAGSVSTFFITRRP